MDNADYGISDLSFEGKISKVIKFGDGLTSIFDAYWPNQFGIQIIRSELINEKAGAFEATKDGDSNWVSPSDVDDESVFIVFDNERSIDTMIERLQYVKDNYKKYK